MKSFFYLIEKENPSLNSNISGLILEHIMFTFWYSMALDRESQRQFIKF